MKYLFIYFKVWEYGDMLSSENKIFTKTCENLKHFMPKEYYNKR